VRFKGVLGIWSWPLLNILLELVQVQSPRSRGVAGLKPIATNIEEWEIVRDGRGRLQKLRVRREVKE